MQTDIAVTGPLDIVLDDSSGARSLDVVSVSQLTKNVAFPYDFDGPAGATNLGLRRGDLVHLISVGANNHDRVLILNSVDADNIYLESTHELVAGDGAVTFDFEFIRRKE